MSIDRSAARQAIRDFLVALGHDPSREGDLVTTPERVVEAWEEELLRGERVDLAALLAEGDRAERPGDLVVVEHLAVATMCPHHLLPALGSATVAYLPGTRVLGLGTLAALVDACSRRLTLQERIGRDVVDALVLHGGARGAWCRLTLRHACLSARGRGRDAAQVHTVAAAGELTDGDARLPRG